MNTLNQDYLKRLISDHQAFRQVLEEIERLINTQDFIGVSSRINSLKKNLAMHTKKEDEKLYFELFDVAKKENMALIQSTINTFSNTMRSITSRIFGFMDRYSDSDKIKNSFTTFAGDFVTIHKDILMRLGSEEKALYSFYEKYCC